MENKFATYLKDVKLELTKVSWPNKDELIGSTIVVLISLAILSLFIGVCDIILSKIVNIIMVMAR
jgi:preprotein translocase subunit SecE